MWNHSIKSPVNASCLYCSCNDPNQKARPSILHFPPTIHPWCCLKDTVSPTLIAQNTWSPPHLGEAARNLINKENTLCFLFIDTNLKVAQRVEEWNTFSSKLAVSRIRRTMYSKNTAPALPLFPPPPPSPEGGRNTPVGSWQLEGPLSKRALPRAVLVP